METKRVVRDDTPGGIDVSLRDARVGRPQSENKRDFGKPPKSRLSMFLSVQIALALFTPAMPSTAAVSTAPLTSARK